MTPAAMWPDGDEEPETDDPETDDDAKQRLKASIDFLKELNNGE